jgi:uroporphyrinogen-III synthase
LTSANAVACLEAHPRRAELLALPAYVVGQRTADAARAAGFGRITSADGDETDLVRLIGTRCAGALVLYLAGEERARDLAADLKSFGIAVETVVAYRALAVSKLPEAICEALAAGNIDGVLHFSRRSAEAYIRCAQNAAILQQALAPAHYALSQQVVEPLALAGADTIFIADRPDEAALINLIAASPG